MKRANRGGRPRREPRPGERVPLGLRVTPELKAELDRATAHSGRSQSQEAEFRLEQSFRDQSLLAEALELKFGAGLAGMLLAIGWAMRDAGRAAAFNKHFTLEAADNWLDDPYAYAQAANAAATVLLAARPEGDPTPRDHKDAKLAAIFRALGQITANGVVESVRGRPASVAQKEQAEPIRALLGHISKRMKWPKVVVDVEGSKTDEG